MTPERWARVQSVFAGALEQSPQARAQFLEATCNGDSELRQEVESLLDSHDNATSEFLEAPADRDAGHALATGGRLGAYEILGPLGKGGMGEVYRARDRRLDREVAIKVLPQHLSASPAALSRFEREAKAVAALSHPNILAIFDFGSEGGVAFAVTELLEGQTLRERLEGEGVTRRQAVEYGLQVAQGLLAAHDKGVIHRDLKPENIFLTRLGHVKILDFGLAKKIDRIDAGKETSAPTLSGETEPGSVMGTVGYMSPEQVRGIPVDHRSDIFSLGAILYEMLAGRRAFRRETPGDTLAAILRDDPPELSRSGGAMPPGLDRTVRHCLEKDRDARFQSVRDVVFALSEPASSAGSSPAADLPAPDRPSRRKGAATFVAVALAVLAGFALVVLRRAEPAIPGEIRPAAAAKAHRIAVLPFENLGAPGDAYFAAGLTEELISRLANARGLSVTSRTTAVNYDRKGKTSRQIGTDLGVDYILEGTVRPEREKGKPSRVRVTPELVRVSDDTPIWSDRYNREVSDIFAIQSDLADKVVKAMGIELMPREKTALEAAFTNDAEAYDLYLKGLEFVHKGQTHQNLEAAARHFRAAVDRDPRFAQALNQLARTELFTYFMLYDRSSGPVERARRVVDQLEALGPDLADTHIARAFYHYWGRSEYPQALEEFRKALALQPSNTDAISGTSMVLARLGRWKEAIPLDESWVALDPQSAQAWGRSGQTLMLLGRYDAADAALQKAVKFNPRFNIPWALRVRILILKNGDAGAAQAVAAEASRVPGLQDDSLRLSYEAYQAFLLGRDYARALGHLEKDPRDNDTPFFAYPVELLRAQAYALSGKPDLARTDFEAARRKLEDKISKDLKDSRFPSALGLALAGLGRHEEGLAAAGKAVEMMPESRDAWRGLFRIQDLALVEAMTGRTDSSIDHLDHLLTKSGEFSAGMLRIDPRWEPLKSNPRFEQMLQKHDGASKEGL